MKIFLIFSICLITTTIVKSQFNPNFIENHSVIVHLFEWKWKDIAKECEDFLGPKGYGGVQVSPVNENIKVSNRPWYERYQPISYLLVTRSGSEAEFSDMTHRCNAAGVRIYVDAVFNHMGAQFPAIGTAGSDANPREKDFPAVPFHKNDFHQSCSINDWNDPIQIRNCELVGLPDLDQKSEWVRDHIVNFLNHLIDLGVAGFRIDAAKHMWPEDLKVIYSRLNNLNKKYSFSENLRPFIYQEVIDQSGGKDAVKNSDYTGLGTVTEFRFSSEIKKIFTGNNPFKWLKNWGPEWNLLPSDKALIFVDNHDTQRGNDQTLTYKTSRNYKMATAFKLGHTYGIPKIMSSFAFDSSEQGPPQDSNENIISPKINSDNTCGNGWICEHRWRQIYNMVDFRRIVAGTFVTNFWDNGNNQMAFCRGNKGFLAFNLENFDLNRAMFTCLPQGTYCDVISGDKVGKTCTGRSVVVDSNGYGIVGIKVRDEDGVLAIHESVS